MCMLKYGRTHTPTNRVSFPRLVFRFQKEFIVVNIVVGCYVSPVQNNLRV